jgi:hypothetical protein
MKLYASRQIFEKFSKTSNFIKIRTVAAELFHVDERTDTTKLIVAFRNFANAPKNYEIAQYKSFNYYGLAGIVIQL